MTMTNGRLPPTTTPPAIPSFVLVANTGAPATSATLPPELVQHVLGLVANQLTNRNEWLNRFIHFGDPRRDIDKECGYGDWPPTAEAYRDLYSREAVAARVVEVLPRESWQVTPTVYEEEDSDTPTAFEEAWDNLSGQLMGGSKYQDEAGSPVWWHLKRADVESGIGHYGVILLGLNDGMELDQPARGVEERNSARGKRGEATAAAGVYNLTFNAARAKGNQLLYLRTFPETLAEITQWEQNLTSPRFGHPTMYSITFNDPRESQNNSGVGTGTRQVHWSRVIHVADGEVSHVPRMRPVWRRLKDIEKTTGGSAEMYWQGAFPGLSFETHPSLGGDVDLDVPEMKGEVEKLMNGLQRYLVTKGMSAKTLSPVVVDPTPQIDVQIKIICIQLGIPMRVFMGSERGELASTQDDKAWNDRLKERQQAYITPRIIIPFVDRLIALGILPEPNGYSVEWPDLTSQSETEKAAVALQRVQAMTTWVSAGGDSVMTLMDLLTRELDYDEAEAQAIIDNLAAANEQDGSDTGKSPLLSTVGGVQAIIALFESASKGALDEAQVRGTLSEIFGLSEASIDAMIADGLTPAAQEAGDPTPPEPQDPGPVKVRAGEALVHPETGDTVAKGPPLPKANPFAKGGK